ncbi:MAG TPA: TonB family protein [Bradyrhizobium sp.]|nr:TonB family protein [Bradyrhizobium sp.]
MPAYAPHESITRPRERVYALAAVVVVQLVLGAALLFGLRVDFARHIDEVQRLVQVTLERPPPPPEPEVASRDAPADDKPAPKAEPTKPGGSPGPQRAQALPSVTPVVAVKPNAAPSGGGTGVGVASGSGTGGGAGGNGAGAGGGGRDLELLSGEILPRDYPRRLARAGIGGTVYMRCTVLATGRVARCIVTRSSGVPELDAITPRLIEQRFVYRPATDRAGRPITDDIDVDWTWD